MGIGKQKIVLSVGGSLVVPPGGISIEFLKNLNTFIREQLAEDNNRQFFLVVGGGSTARHYIDAGRSVVGHELPEDDLDWIGIHTTRLNAHLVRTVFRDIAHPNIIKHYEIIRRVEEPVVVAAGWKPGWSTDFCATMICEDYNVPMVVNLSNITQVFDKDPRKHPDAVPFDKMTWSTLRGLVGDVWTPGMNAPFDPIAAKKAQELNLKMIVAEGNDFANLKKALNGEEFVGTIVEGE